MARLYAVFPIQTGLSNIPSWNRTNAAKQPSCFGLSTNISTTHATPKAIIVYPGCNSIRERQRELRKLRKRRAKQERRQTARQKSVVAITPSDGHQSTLLCSGLNSPKLDTVQEANVPNADKGETSLIGEAKSAI
ncbi:unnamed protein product [Protopolystoma xenopodis]|uniref:Uncharacterized protein n=1 Tax=Protopolystoma xenopodis TaxID=117903 RepID=A0A448XQJ8_9PLAT|nr:unnamed protein product [Protopolystoma xenopodis]